MVPFPDERVVDRLSIEKPKSFHLFPNQLISSNATKPVIMSPYARPLMDRIGSFFYSSEDSTDIDKQRAKQHTPANHDKLGKSHLQKPKFPRSWRRKIPPTVSLPLLVLLDMLAVSLVVPLLFQYYQTAGVTRAHERELLSALFSASQIIGGLLVGALTDAKLVRRKSILFLSFGGSALSYALIVYGGLPALIFSRVLVGLVKHTMTVATTMLSNCTTKDTRAKHMGRLTASSTAAWIVGPSIGALAYQYVDERAPALFACAIFATNMVLAAVLLEGDTFESSHPKNDNPDEQSDHTNVEHDEKKKAVGGNTIFNRLKSCFTSKALSSVVLTQLVVTWVSKATSFSQLGSFYEDMYDLPSYHRGYISSFQQLLHFAAQATLVGPVMQQLGGERRTTCLCTAVLSVAVLFKAQGSLWFFLIALCPVLALCSTMIHLSLQTLVTHVAPSESIFSVLAALDVLQNAVSVSVPFYRTILFRLLSADNSAAMQGDPDPMSWIVTSAMHWAVATVAITYLLLWNEGMRTENIQHKKRG